MGDFWTSEWEEKPVKMSREMVMKLLWVQMREDKVGKGRYILRLQFLTQVVEGALL